MAQLLQIDLATAALTTLLAAVLPVSYDPTVDVREASKKDFSDSGELILKKIAVRVRFGQAEYGQARDISRTTLSTSLAYEIVCRHESLRSQEEMRSRCLQLIAAAQQVLAGARLLLPDGTASEPILLRGVFPVSDQFGPVEDCYALVIEISGFAQFPGTYSVAGYGIPAPAPPAPVPGGDA